VFTNALEKIESTLHRAGIWKKLKKERESRVGFAADLLAQGYNCIVMPTWVAEEYQLCRRQARRITAQGMDLIVQDFEEINIEWSRIETKTLVNLEQCMPKVLLNNQSSGVATCASQIILLAGLAADSQ